MQDEQYTIPRSIHEMLLTVRETGEVNMHDLKGVQAIANREGLYALVGWLEDQKSTPYSLGHASAYIHWIFGDCEIEEDELYEIVWRSQYGEEVIEEEIESHSEAEFLCTEYALAFNEGELEIRKAGNG